MIEYSYPSSEPGLIHKIAFTNFGHNWSTSAGPAKTTKKFFSSMMNIVRQKGIAANRKCD
jgi:hypothetical protein